VTTVDLSTTVAGLRLTNPVMNAAGCAGTGRELDQFMDVTRLGAFVTRTITLDARPGWRAPRMTETPSGLLHAAGLQNPGLQGFLASELPWLAQRQVPAIVSVSAGTLAEYAELAGRLGDSPGVAAIEVNLAGVRDEAGRDPATDPYRAGKVLNVVRREAPRGVGVLAKLVPEAAVVDVAGAAVDAGADALVLVDGPAGMAIDPQTLRPVLSGHTGTLSGPATHAAAVRCVWQVHEALPEVPLVGVGGVRSGYDALEMLLAGACAVQVGAALLADPSAPLRILDELTAELAKRGLTGPADVTGLGHRPAPDPEGGEA
jgi:dihydroorotate dehydrogenase (NAD+) catalytic subunit